MNLLYIFLLLMPALAARYAGHNSPASFDLSLAQNPTWMSNLPDRTRLVSLSIPGTHNSLTFRRPISRIQTQNHGLRTQLNAGIRFLDFRGFVGHRGEINMYHGVVRLGISLGRALDMVEEFLHEHPGEMIVLRLREEKDAHSISFRRSFTDVFADYCDPDSRLYHPATRRISPTTKFPLGTLGQHRGEILLLQEWNSQRSFGVPYINSGILIDDDWEIRSPEQLAAKIKTVYENLETAGLRGPQLCLTYMNAAQGISPLDAAAGDGEEGGMNDIVLEWLRENRHSGTVGVVIADFPGEELVTEILSRNNRLERVGKDDEV